MRRPRGRSWSGTDPWFLASAGSVLGDGHDPTTHSRADVCRTGQQGGSLGWRFARETGYSASFFFPFPFPTLQRDERATGTRGRPRDERPGIERSAGEDGRKEADSGIISDRAEVAAVVVDESSGCPARYR